MEKTYKELTGYESLASTIAKKGRAYPGRSTHKTINGRVRHIVN